MYICNSSVALKVAHITDLCNHACHIVGDRQRLKHVNTTDFCNLQVQCYADTNSVHMISYDFSYDFTTLPYLLDNQYRDSIVT